MFVEVHFTCTGSCFEVKTEADQEDIVKASALLNDVSAISDHTYCRLYPPAVCLLNYDSLSGRLCAHTLITCV